MHTRTNKYRIERLWFFRVTSRRPHNNEFLEKLTPRPSLIKIPLQLKFWKQIHFCLFSSFFLFHPYIHFVFSNLGHSAYLRKVFSVFTTKLIVFFVVAGHLSPILLLKELFIDKISNLPIFSN